MFHYHVSWICCSANNAAAVARGGDKAAFVMLNAGATPERLGKSKDTDHERRERDHEIAQRKEMIEDPSQKIGRPRQLYVGLPRRDYVPVDKRSQ
jgi:hypothetical protein